MSLRDPFAAYNAATYVEAQMVCNALLDAGIEAVVIEDVSGIGWGWAGPSAEVHKPQVWIERADIDRAAPVLTEYERVVAERRAADQATGSPTEPPVEVTCEECGKPSTF